MSYEGYTQCLTNKGHYFTVDTYEDENRVLKDLYPNEFIVWTNQVDTTNGSFETINGKTVRIDGHITLEIDKPSRTEIQEAKKLLGEIACKLPPSEHFRVIEFLAKCSSKKYEEPATYKIPKT